MKLSVLQNFKPEHLKMDPFPHIHIPQVLPWELYKQLEEEYPEEHILNGETLGFGDKRYQQKDWDYSFITPLWKAFADFHTSKSFKDEVVQVLNEAIRTHYGDKLHIKYARSEVKLRYDTGPVDAMKMEMQFVINAIDSQHIRTPHVDQARELFAFLFYFKKFDDKGDDGGLNIYKKKTTGQWRRQGGGREALPDDIEVVGHIPYTKNTLVAFLNTVDSIHGVTPRNNPNTVRRYVNIDCHVQEKLFKFGEESKELKL